MIDRVVDCISKYDNFAVLTHVNPDGDAVGSSFAFASALCQLGKNAVCVFNEALPDKYMFLAREELLKFDMDDFPLENGCIVCLDCANKKRLGVFAGSIPDDSVVVNIDHHVTNEGYGDINYIEKRPAAGELVFDILKRLGIAFSPYICNAIYTAIFTDTGRFSYEDTNKNTFLIAAELCEYGLDIPYVANEVYAARSFEATQLIKKIIENLHMFYAGRVAVTSISLTELSDIGADISDCETAIDYAREIKGAEIAVFIREMEKNYYKVSFRSKTDADVAEIAAYFGGGGHKKASGCAVRGEFYDIQDKVLDILKNYI